MIDRSLRNTRPGKGKPPPASGRNTGHTLSTQGNNNKASGRLIVVSGPSGVGKSTIVRQVLNRCTAGFSISMTTRAPRTDEADRREYRFVDRDEFNEMIAAGEMLEWAEVFGELYGTPAGPIREAIRAGRTVLLDIDVQGAMQVHQKMPGATFVLVVPPDDDELVRRLTARRSENAEQLHHRLGQARKEIDTATASGVYNHVVINNDLVAAVRQVLAIIEQECCER